LGFAFWVKHGHSLLISAPKPANPMLTGLIRLEGWPHWFEMGADGHTFMKGSGLKEPEFIRNEMFRTIIWCMLQTGEQSTA
jgi:hypothetical protein